MLFVPLWVMDTASFEWRPEQEVETRAETLQQVWVALQSALTFVLNDSAGPMMLEVSMVERLLFGL